MRAPPTAGDEALYARHPSRRLSLAVADLIRSKGDTQMTVEQLTTEIIPRGRGALALSAPTCRQLGRARPVYARPLDSRCPSRGVRSHRARRHQGRPAAADTPLRRAAALSSVLAR